MSLLKLERAFGMLVILIAAGTCSLRAQTPAVAEKVSPSITPMVVPAPEPMNIDAIKSPLSQRSAGTDDVLETKPRPVKSNVVLESSGSTGSVPVEASATTVSQSTSSAPNDDEWKFQFTPYLWLVSISGRTGIGNLVVDTDKSLTNSNVELDFGFMSTFEARKNKFVILTDLQYSSLSTERGNPGPLFSSSRAGIKTFILEPDVGYRVLDNGEGASVDVLGGIRYWHLNVDLEFRPGILPAVNVSRSRGWVDGVAGLRGKAPLSERWFVTGEGDLGGGGSNFTYHLFGGVGLNLGKRIALIGGYRDLNVNYNKDGFLFDMSLHGPILGFGIKF